MIAQKSQVDGYELQELSSSKGSSTSVSLFDGLTINLPDVPSRPVSDIVRNDRSQLLPTRPVAVDHDNIIAEKCSAPPIEDASLDSSAMEVNEYSSLLPSVDQNPMTSHKEAQKPSKDLSVLYTPIEIVTATADMYNYPELPQISRFQPQPPQSIDRNPTSSSVAHGRLVHATSPPTAAIARSDPTTHDSNALVNELLSENSRLSEEVTSLRSQLAVLQTQGPGQAVSRGQQQAAVNASPSTAVTGVHVGNPRTENPVADAKYVCCGHCRQWLRAHKDAVFIRCTQCDAVNNCSLVPVTRASSNTQMDSLALQQQSNNQ